MDQIALPALLALSGLGFILAAALAVYLRWQFVGTAVRASGEVVDYKVEESNFEDSDGRITRAAILFPIVQFTDAAGLQRRAETSAGSAPPPFRIGAQVTVLYDPADPARAEIEAFRALWLVPAILAGLGSLQLLVAAVLLVSSASA